MAESPLQKLQRLAREKRAAEASAAASAQAVSEEKKDELVDDSNTVVADVHVLDVQATEGSESNGLSVNHQQADSVSSVVHGTDVSSSVSANFPDAPPARSASNHPLAMQFAELEQGILARDPQFKTILRDIHRHLGSEPELVTQMTEAEVALVVQGLVQRAQEEIVAPAAAKSAKAAVRAAGKKTITVDDL